MALLFASLKDIGGFSKLDCFRSCPCSPLPDPSFQWGCCLAGRPVSRAAGALCRRTFSLPSQVFPQSQGNGGPLHPPSALPSAAIISKHKPVISRHNGDTWGAVSLLPNHPSSSSRPKTGAKAGREPLPTCGNSKSSSQSRHQSQGEDWAAPCPAWAGSRSWYPQPAASYQAAHLQPPPVQESRNQLQGWQRQGCSGAGERHRLRRPQSTWHGPGGIPPTSPAPRLSTDVPLAHGEEAGEPLESHGMKALVNQGHSSAPLAPCAIYSAPGAHPGGVQPLGCRLLPSQPSCLPCSSLKPHRGLKKVPDPPNS